MLYKAVYDVQVRVSSLYLETVIYRNSKMVLDVIAGSALIISGLRPRINYRA